MTNGRPHSIGGDLRRDLPYLGLALLVVLLVTSIHFVLNQRFYYISDNQTQFLPAFFEVARLIKSGEAPWISLHSWAGGNLAGEYLYGIFNPVSLALYLAISTLDSLTRAAFLFVSAYILICTAGVYYLARQFGIRTQYAALAAFAIGTNNFLVYWHAACWLPEYVSFAWFPWAVLFLVRSASDRRSILASAVATFLLITSGYPNTVLAFVIAAALLAGIELFRARSVAKALWHVPGPLLGLLMAAPALAAFVAHFLASDRASIAGVGEASLSGTFVGLVSFGFPSFLDISRFFFLDMRPYGVIESPIYFAAWYPLAAAAAFRWEALGAERTSPLRGLLMAIAAFFFLSMMPDIGPFRWSYKFVPFYHLFVVLAASWMLSQRDLLVFGPARRRALIGAIVLLFVVSSEYSPFYIGSHVIFLACLLAGVAAFSYHFKSSDRALGGALGAVSLVIVAMTAFLWRTTEAGGGVADLNVPGRRSAIAEAYGIEPADRVLALSSIAGTDLSPYASQIPPGNVVYFLPGRFINGYTSLGPKGLYELLCTKYGTLICRGVAARIFSLEPRSGRPYVDLLRLNKIIVQKGPHLDEFMAAKNGDWISAADNESSRTFVRQQALAELPGTIAQLPPGVRITESLSMSTRHESYRLDLEKADFGRPLVFGRAWYPGYEAHLDGRPIRVIAYGGLMTAAVLPREISGSPTLTLDYRLPGEPVIFVVAALALVAAATLSLISTRRVAGE